MQIYMARGRFMIKDMPGGCFCKDLDIDYISQYNFTCTRCADNLPATTIKRLSFKRRPRGASDNTEASLNVASSSQWHSAESLLSNKDGTREVATSRSTRGRPPLPPPHTSTTDKKTSRNNTEVPNIEGTQCMEEKNTLEMQEVISPAPPQPLPRRRLASFGGLSCPESSSLFTGLGAYNQFKDGHQPGATGNLTAYTSSSVGSTQSLKVSPQSSGRSTPVTGLGSVQLQNVREQMVVALQKLKELEEQVKIIPVLELKISVLQEDKRQLLYELKKHRDEDTKAVWKMAHSQERLDISTQYFDDSVHKENIQLTECKKLSEKVQSAEQQRKSDLIHARQKHAYSSDKQTRSVATGTDKERDFVCCEHHCQSKGKQMRSIAIEVTENSLGINSKRDDELLAHQEMIYSLKEKIGYLETELKESTLQIEMNRLKLELQAAEGRNNKKMDKASSASPSTVSTSTEARPSTKSQAVGNHVTVCDASTGEVTEVKNVGISCCRMMLQNVRSGPSVQWVVREMVDTADKSTGFQILTSSQGVGTCIKLCDTGTNTDSGVASVSVNFSKDHCIDQGIMASTETASQHTNTVRTLVSRFTNTKQAFNTDSITNTIIKSQDKHTNTPATITRTVSVGSRVQDMHTPLQTRTIGVGTSHFVDSDTLQPNLAGKVTRDASVGFININENFLIGIKTRNMASGPSHLPDPLKTRSVGVGEGKIWDSPPKESREVMANQPLKDTELNYYIEEMQRFLTEHKDLLKEERTCIPNQHKSSQRNVSPTQLCKITQEGNDGTALDTSESTHKESQVICPDDDTCTGAKPNEVKRMIQMLEQQTSSTLQDKAANPWSVCKKKNSDQSCSTSRKNMRLMGVATGLEPVSSNITSDTGTAMEKIQTNKAAIIKTNNEGSKEKKYNKHFSSKRPKGSDKSSLQESCRFKLSEKMLSACQNLRKHLSDGTDKRTKDFKDAIQTLKQEWFNISCQKSAAPHAVDIYLSAFQDVSPLVLQYVVNMADSNGNTALHYCVSYSNFGVVKKLLNTDVCNVNLQNKAGYTPIMLAALASVTSPEHMSVVKELFSKGNVNAKASQAGQTALMLAVSNGSLEMVQALLEQGAEVNLQDDEGSTALMCASEHGHEEILKLLLQQPNCDATLTDSDESTALSIALEAGHKEIAVLLYAHANFSKGNSGTSVGPAPPSSPGRKKCI